MRYRTALIVVVAVAVGAVLPEIVRAARTWTQADRPEVRNHPAAVLMARRPPAPVVVLRQTETFTIDDGVELEDRPAGDYLVIDESGALVAMTPREVRHRYEVPRPECRVPRPWCERIVP